MLNISEAPVTVVKIISGPHDHKQSVSTEIQKSENDEEEGKPIEPTVVDGEPPFRFFH